MSTSVVGDVCERIESSFEWRIPNWESCQKEIFHSHRSPLFQFWDATWALEILCYPKNARSAMQFGVVRNTWKQNRQIVALKLSARQKDGTEHIIRECKHVFTEISNNYYSSFIEKEFVFHQLVHDDNLRISCSLYGYRSNAKAATQKSEVDNTKKTDTLDTEDEVKRVKSGTKDLEKLSRNFKYLLFTGRDSDVTVKVNDREFLVHKLILGARSSILDKMFRHDMAEKKKGVVDVKDCTTDAFKEFLLYLYSGEQEKFSRNTVFDLYSLSDKYDVHELKAASVEFMVEDLCIDNFCEVVHLVLQHSESVLLEKAAKFFAKNLKKIIVSIKWQSFITENPIQANELYIKALNDVLPE